MSNLSCKRSRGLRSQLREHWNACRRLRRYSFYGISLTLLGLGILYFVVDHLNVNRFVAHALVVPVIMFVLSYIVHRHRSFGDRQTRGYKFKKRYAVVRLGGMGVSKLSFFVLVAIAGLPYLVVSLTITLGLAWPTYRLMRDWAFVQEAEVQLAESPGALASALGFRFNHL